MVWAVWKTKNFWKKAPVLKLKINSNGRFVQSDPWESGPLKRVKRNSATLWKNFEDFPNSKSYNLAQEAQLKCEKLLRKDIFRYEKKITSQMTVNPKRFYSYLNSKRKIKNSFSCFKNEDGNMTSTAKETADVHIQWSHPISQILLKLVVTTQVI